MASTLLGMGSLFCHWNASPLVSALCLSLHFIIMCLLLGSLIWGVSVSKSSSNIGIALKDTWLTANRTPAINYPPHRWSIADGARTNALQTCSMSWGVLSSNADCGNTWCATALLSIAPDCWCYNALYDSVFLRWSVLNPIKMSRNPLGSWIHGSGILKGSWRFSRNFV